MPLASAVLMLFPLCIPFLCLLRDPLGIGEAATPWALCCLRPPARANPTLPSQLNPEPSASAGISCCLPPPQKVSHLHTLSSTVGLGSWLLPAPDMSSLQRSVPQQGLGSPQPCSTTCRCSHWCTVGVKHPHSELGAPGAWESPLPLAGEELPSTSAAGSS